MSRSGRSQFFAYLTGLGIAFALGALVTSLDYYGDYQERYPRYADTPDASQPAPPQGAPRIGAPSYKTPCENPQGHDESDLCAQWRAAGGAKQAARWGLWQFIISIFGVIGLGVTLWFNKRAIDLALESGEDTERALAVAERNAEAAADHVKIAQEASYRDLRAYISVEVEGLHASSQILSGSVIVKNAGQTPAHIRVFTSTWIGPWPTHEPAAVGPPAQEDIHHQPYVNRGSTEKLSWFYPMPDDDDATEIAKLFAEDSIKWAILVYGRVEFTDFMRRERVLHFSYRNAVALDEGQPFEMVPTPGGNQYEDRSKPA